MKKVIALLAAALLALAAYAAAGPFIAIHSIRGAIERHDTAALARHVDFPALRANLRAQLEDHLVRRAGAGMQADPLGALALRVAGAATGAVVDVLATPAGIALVLEGRDAWHRVSGGGISPTDTWAHVAPEDVFADAGYRFESPSRFTAAVRNRDGAPVVFVLTRDGLRWRVSDVRLPLRALEPVPAQDPG